MYTTSRRIFLLLAALTVFSLVVRSEQSQKTSHTAVAEDRIKKLEDRADAAEKAASAAALEKDYIVRTQKLYESYYQKTFALQMWTLAIVGFLLVAVFALVVRFSMNMFEQRTKLATADATAQMRNEHARILAKEVQKLWDSNAADNKKLKEALTAQFAQVEQNLKNRSDFEMHFVQGLAGGAGDRHDDSVLAFRQALVAYKAGKPQNLIESKLGTAALWHIFESLQKKHGEHSVDKSREELGDPLYNGLEQELALVALQSPWLTPLINERTPANPEPPAPEPAAARPMPPMAHALPVDAELLADEESDSCRLISN